jgi:hypothetical protein
VIHRRKGSSELSLVVNWKIMKNRKWCKTTQKFSQLRSEEAGTFKYNLRVTTKEIFTSSFLGSFNFNAHLYTVLLHNQKTTSAQMQTLLIGSQPGPL